MTDFRSKSKKAQEAVTRTLGGRVYQTRTFGVMADEISRQDVDQSVMLIGNRVEREFRGRKYTDFNLQVEFDPIKAYSLLRYVSEVKEDDPRGLVTQRAVQRVLGGSDPAAQVDGDPRALRKILADEKKWSVDWIGLVPRDTNGLTTVLGTLGAFSLTEQREARELGRFGFHREQKGGAFFPYMLKEEFEEETEELREKRKRLEQENGVNLPRKWTDEYAYFINQACMMFIHYGVPGIREMITIQWLVYDIEFTQFNCEGFKGEWLERKNADMKPGQKPHKPYEMYTNWLVQPHCALIALEESFKYQTTPQAGEMLKALLENLIKSRVFLTKEKIPFGRITKWFEDARIPYVIEEKIYNVNQQKWKSYKLPKSKWQVNNKEPNCIYIKLGQWNAEHYFYWREDVNNEYGIKNWPKKYREKISLSRKPTQAEFQTNPTREEIYILPSYSSGRLLTKLVEQRFVVPITGEFEAYSNMYEDDEKPSLFQELEFFYRNPDELRKCCVPDIDENLKKKLGPKKIPRKCLFAGDTESFIDPETGVHEPSLLIIKGIYRNDITIKSSLWDCVNPIREGMKQFVTQYTEWVYKKVRKAAKVESTPGKELKRRLDKNSNIKTVNQLVKAIRGISNLTSIFDMKLLRPRIYFHNLGYDIQAFLTEFSPCKREVAIKKGAVWYSMTFKFLGCEFILRNSFTIITTALKNFPKMFLPKEEQAKMKKEVFAYDAINRQLMESKTPQKGFIVGKTTLKYAIDMYEYHKNNEEKEKLLEELWKTASDIGCVDGDFIDIGKYTIYYCERDVDLLAIGLKAWEAIGEQDASKSTFKGLPPFKKFDVYNFMSAPAIAQAVTEVEVRKGCIVKLGENEKPFDCTYKYKGRLREFMLHCTFGGRCTLANEKRQLVDCCKDDPKVKELIKKSQTSEKLTKEDQDYLYLHLIQDFDARSLYPTAMSNMSIPLGPPEVVFFGKDSTKNQDWLRTLAVNNELPDDAMYLITDIKYKLPLALPTNSWKQEKPEPRCRWNNQVPSGVVQLRKLTDLRTMWRFQRAEFRILGGLEWRHGKWDKIKEFMPAVYAFRVLNHSGGFDHPIQEAAKLIMNSFYGKNVTKMRNEKELFFPARKWVFNKETNKLEEQSGHYDLFSYIKHNWRSITQVQYMGGCFIVKMKDKDESAYDVNFGCEVLAGSRAVICPVSALVELVTKQPCLYTDTDSLHLYGWQVEAIAPYFKQYFDKDMIGKELGQFHVDFEPRTFKKGETCLGSSFFCGVGKKMYIDELRGSEGSCEYHRRAKGIKAEYLSKEEYLRLYYGETLYKNLDECGMVQIRQKEGHNLSVHMVKQVRATAEGEVEVITDLIESKDGDRLIEDAAGELLFVVDQADIETEDEAEITQVDRQAEKRGREDLVVGNEDDTVELIESDMESEQPRKEEDTTVEILDVPKPVSKRAVDEVQMNIQRWLRDFNAWDKAMMYKILERLFAGDLLREDDWFFLSRLRADKNDRVYAREAMRQLQQDLPQFQDKLIQVK